MNRYLLFLLLLLQTGTLQAQRLLEFLPEKPARTAVIVCPGGSYCWLSKRTEGTEVAQWLNANGMAAYVLYYPTAGWAGFAWHTRWIFRGHQYPDQLRALQDAVRKVRAKGYKTVGAIGFSAGGHLVLNGAEEAGPQDYLDFVAGIYPVVTMREPSVHHRSRRGLMGERSWRDPVMCDSLSVELHADRISCPVFLMNCKDDPIVPYHNAELMDSALTAHAKPHMYVEYSEGGHGFGVNPHKTTPEAIRWMGQFLFFLYKFVGIAK